MPIFIVHWAPTGLVLCSSLVPPQPPLDTVDIQDTVDSASLQVLTFTSIVCLGAMLQLRQKFWAFPTLISSSPVHLGTNRTFYELKNINASFNYGATATQSHSCSSTPFPHSICLCVP